MFEHLLWHSPGLVPIAIGASLLIVIAVVWTYWPQMRALNGRWKWLLPSLRAVALVLLAISIIRPVIVRAKTPAERGAIVLLIDRSPSMSVQDIGRTPSQLVALAEGLQMLPRGIRPKSAIRLEETPDTLRTTVNDLFLARGQLDYARIAGQSTDTAEQRLEDLSNRIGKLSDELSEFTKVSRLLQQLGDIATQNDAPAEKWARSVSDKNDELTAAIVLAQTSADNDLYRSNDDVRQACDELSAMSRLSIVNQALTSNQSKVLPRLLQQAPVFGFTFADDLTPVPLEDESGALGSLPLGFSGNRSDLTGALRAVRQMMQGQPVQAIVLFSDGRQVGAGGDLAQVLATANATIYTVNCAGPVKRDLALVRLSAPVNAFVGQTAAIRVDLRGVGFRGSVIDLVLEAEGKKLTQKITLDEDRVASAEFPVRFEHPGDQTLSVSIPPQSGETTTENNRVEKRIKVLADKVKVLAVTGAAGWDFQFLQSTLAGSPFIESRSQIFTPDSPKLLATPEEILKQDVVVLSDIHAAAISKEQSAAIANLVRKEGGSVFIIPGDPKNLVELSQLPGMADLLPFNDVQDAAWRVWPGEEPFFQFSAASGEENSDALKLADDPVENLARWSSLDGMFRFMPVPDPREELQPLLIERDSELPVLTQMPAGAGRAFFFGARETWRWRLQNNARDQEQFWLQLMRYAAKPRESSGDVEVTQETLAELANVAGDDQRLRRIATGSGGDAIAIDDVADLPTRIHDAGEKLPAFSEYPVWDSGYLLVFVVGCFGVEWAMRKRAGLV